MEKTEHILNNLNLDTNTLYDLLYNLFLQLELDKSEDDIKNGNTITLEELGNHIKELGATHEHNNNK